jgi:chromosome segregation ATPase
VTTRESWDLEGLQRLEEKIAKENGALIDIQKTLADQKTLYKEAKRTAQKRTTDADRINRLVSDKSAERDQLLEEERELERRRAAIHSRAVEVENERANLVAQAVLAKEEARASESIASQRKEGIKQARAIEEAHMLALQKLEQHRMELKRKEVDVHVRGDAIPKPKEVDINVNVLPKSLPEARIESDAVYRGADLKSHLQESVPHHSKTVLSPKGVRASEAHRQTTTVERHVVDRGVL